MTTAAEIVDPWLNGDPCMDCTKCDRLCLKLKERIESVLVGKDKEIVRLREALQHCVNALAEYEKELNPPPRRKQPADLKPFLLGALDNVRAALKGDE